MTQIKFGKCDFWWFWSKTQLLSHSLFLNMTHYYFILYKMPYINLVRLISRFFNLTSVLYFTVELLLCTNICLWHWLYLGSLGTILGQDSSQLQIPWVLNHLCLIFSTSLISTKRALMQIVVCKVMNDISVDWADCEWFVPQ